MILLPDPANPNLYHAEYAYDIAPLKVTKAKLSTLPGFPAAHLFSLIVPDDFEEGDVVTVDATNYRHWATPLYDVVPALFHNVLIEIWLTAESPWRTLRAIIPPPT